MTPARILIIDDDAVTREILFEILEEEGFAVKSADNGKVGLQLHRENPYDLIVTDIIMPEMEGLETILELRRVSPRVKIIAVSGGGRLGPEGYLNAAGKLGADLTFGKPFDPMDIVKSIQQLLNEDTEV